MAESIILEFKGVGKNEYDQVNKILGIDRRPARATGLTGLLNHTGAITATAISSCTRSGSRRRRKRRSWLASARRCRRSALPEPSRMEWFNVIGHYHTALALRSSRPADLT